MHITQYMLMYMHILFMHIYVYSLDMFFLCMQAQSMI